MNRNELWSRVRELREPVDVLIVGGGATGVGIAIDAASRGYSTLLVEQDDFGKATSSRATKLVHGGVRYLAQGNIKLVREALHERALLLQNAPHLVRPLAFVLPGYRWWEKYYYGLGLKVYDALAFGRTLGPSRLLSRRQALEHAPTLEPEHLSGGVLYYDGQFDDARLLITMVRSAFDQGATLLNRVRAAKLLTGTDGKVQGAVLHDLLDDDECQVRARVVVNATGIFTDQVRTLADPSAKPWVKPSQGIHLVFDRKFLENDTAIIVPKTADGRVLFAIPWHRHVVVGTTDTPVDQPSLEPRALEEEVNFVMTHARKYLSKDPTDSDILSVYAGQRPLVNAGGYQKTASLSRDHLIAVEPSGLVTITGGKWTTYRRMAQDLVDRLPKISSLPKRPCQTETLKLRGAVDGGPLTDEFKPYGSDLPEVDRICRELPGGEESIHAKLPSRKGEVVWAARQELALTVEDFLARRTRGLFLDSVSAIESAPEVARLLADELGYDADWQRQQVASFTELALGYRWPAGSHASGAFKEGVG